MTNLEETTHRLRAALDELVADVPAAPRRPPASVTAVGITAHGSRSRRWQRPVALGAIAVAAVFVLGAVVVFGPRSTPPSTASKIHRHSGIAVHAAPPGWINLPLLLPSTTVDLQRATVASGPVPVPSTGTYEQVYRGAQTTNPPELLITTVMAAPGAISGYAGNSQSVDINGATAYLTNFPDHQLLWQTADGVVVSLESTEMTAADVLAAGRLVEPHPATDLGVDIAGALPDGLVFAGEGFANGDTGQNQDEIFFQEGSCHAYTQVWAGSAADFAPVAVISDVVHIVTIGGTPALSVQFGDTQALLWSEEPGVDVRLQGSGCDLPAMATAMRVVDPETWTSAISSLGSQGQTYTPRVPTPAPGLPAGGTFGLAH